MNEICTEIAYLAESHLNLKDWGFKENQHSNEYGSSKTPFVIYSSQLCKIKISFNEWHPPHQSKEFSIDFYYGRLSAPNDQMVMIWNNEECHCWHSVVKALHFLDNSTAEYTTKNLFSHELIKEYSKLLSADNLVHKLPEWEIRKHAYIWKKYALQLFDLFDLNQTDLWKKYEIFLKDVYDIKGRNTNIKPPLDKVC